MRIMSPSMLAVNLTVADAMKLDQINVMGNLRAQPHGVKTT